ncbi:MAG: TonB-dependent receptor [Dysgonamonadaceae bacterium]|jgi:TonB-linked SusC/RagA family outer membrane protein|nr:TonB-dependent receptor [Dysgonamonadaceae bacterium]
MGKSNTTRIVILLFFAVFTGSVFAQNIQVTGRVTDVDGEFMIGVSILEKGTSNGTVTDVNGIYNITVTTKNPVLVATYIGYEPQEMKVSRSVVDFVLKESVSMLDEVQVVGYGRQRKVSVLGAQSNLKMEQVKAPVANLGTVLAGRVSGLVAVQRTGLPGHDDADIWIRGISTLTNVNQGPLILVDGIERDFNQLDPEDIESVSVLKDASSTAVYGVRGGNGVIIITTKPGVVSTPRFTFDAYQGVTQLTQIPELVNAYQYMDAVNEAYRNTYGRPYYSEQYITNTKMANGVIPNTGGKTVNKYLYPDVNWMDELYNKYGWNRRGNVNIRGGAPNASYYVSLSYYDEKGLTKTDPNQPYNTEITYNRYNFLTNINLKATPKTEVDVGVSGWFSSGNYPERDLESDIFAKAMMVNPVIYPKEFPDGRNPGFSQFQREFDNPYGELTKRGYKNEYRTQVNTNLKLTQKLDFWNWSKGLQAHALIAFDIRDNQTLHYRQEMSTWIANGTKTDDVWNDDAYDEDGSMKLREAFISGDPSIKFEGNRDSYRTFYYEGALNYNRVFGKIHNVSGLVLLNGRDYRDPNGNQIKSLPFKQLSICARGAYSYNDRYFFEANAGYTGSENYDKDNRFGFFPAIAFGWVPSNELFWESINRIVPYLKIRYSNGIVGNDSMGDDRFGYYTEISGGGEYDFHINSGGPGGGLSITKYGYKAQWSTIQKQDLGIEVNFLNNDLAFVFDIFKEHRDHIYIHRENLPLYEGFAAVPTGNFGIVENKGFEASFDYNCRLGKNWNVAFRGNFTMNEDEVVEDGKPVKTYSWQNTVGQNVLVRMGYVAEGLYADWDEITERNICQFGETYPGELVRPGDIKYSDLNNDGKIDEYDMKAIGRGDVPKYYYGFGGDFRYKNLGLGILFQGTAGADRLLDGSGIRPFTNSSGGGSLYSNIENRWDPENPTNDDVFYPRLAWSSADKSNVNNFVPSTWWQKDMSFLRLKQFTLSYYFPQSWCKKSFITGGRFYVMGSNVYTWSKFNLWDPELNTNSGIRYPNVTAYTFGVNFSF